MSSALSTDRIVFHRREFRKFVLSENRFQKQELESEDQKNILNKIRELLQLYVGSADEYDLQYLAKELLKVIPAFSGQRLSYYRSFANRLSKEALIWHQQNSGVVGLSVQDFRTWFQSCQSLKLNQYAAFILLAVYLCESAELKAIQLQVKMLTGFDNKTVRNYLNELHTKYNLLQVKNSDDVPPHKQEYMTTRGRSWEEDFCDAVDTLFSRAILLDEQDHNESQGYVIHKDVFLTTPFVRRVGSQRIDISRMFLSPQLVAISLLDEKQLLGWLNIAYKSKPKQKRDTILELVSNFIRLRLIKYSGLDKHYHQISKIFPLLHRIGRHGFEIDLISELPSKRNSIHQSLEVAKSELMIELASLAAEATYNWDIDAFIICLTTPDPAGEWHRQFPDTDIVLYNLYLRRKDLPETESPFVAMDSKDNKGHNAETLSGPVVLKSGEWTVDDLKELPSSVRGAAGINRILESSTLIRSLDKIYKFTYNAGRTRLVFQPDIVSSVTHRIHFVHPSSQNIPKAIRSICRSSPGHIFLFVDISAMELNILKAYLIREGYANKSDLNELTFEAIAKIAKVDRKTVKNYFYPELYGAKEETIRQETGLSKEQIKRIQNAFTAFPQLKAFDKTTIYQCRQSGESPATLLGYRMPVHLKKSYRGLAYLIQATGAEIFREWILNLAAAGLSEHIVNLVHDEILFEIPEEENVGQYASQVRAALRATTGILMPECELDITVYTGKRWVKEEAMRIIPEYSE